MRRETTIALIIIAVLIAGVFIVASFIPEGGRSQSEFSVVHR
jgi:hypothetical protein